MESWRPRWLRAQATRSFSIPSVVSRLAINLILSILLGGCAGVTSSPSAPSALNPRGPAAAHIANLWWVLFGLGAAIYLVVMAALLLGLTRSRRAAGGESIESRGRAAILWGGLILPAAVLVIVFGFTLGTLRATALPQVDEDLTIEVVGRRWWWEVHYPNQQVSTANEIHIPTGRPVLIKLLSEEVIHSFWVPQLHGKMDAIPGRVNTFWIQADQPGQYWGECAEFCGVQHAKMLFLVVAEPPDEFAGWLENQSQPAVSPAGDAARQGEALFLSAGCMNCHTVRGTQATGELGPDLTHFASRRILGSGAAENTRGSLAGWIANPHSLKPGNLMPPSNLSSQDLNALLAYMETLR